MILAETQTNVSGSNTSIEGGYTLWNKYDHERPDYKTYVKRMKKREKVEAEFCQNYK